MNDNDERLLLVLPLKAYSVKDRIFVDSQACNGLRLWLKHFQCITLACPTSLITHAPQQTSPIDSIDGFERLTFVALPTAYTPTNFVLYLPKVIKLLNEHSLRANYLHFAIGGLWGDWASIASLLAYRTSLPFAVWTDRVESQVAYFHSKSKTGLRRFYTLVTAWLMAHYERYIIRRCSLGLFHGMDCYQAYSSICSNPHLVHDIHLGEESLVTPSNLETRLSHSIDGPLRLAYAGRVHRDKGVYDWVEVLSIAAHSGVEFSGTWFGSGPELLAARSRVDELGLNSRINFPGPVQSHSALMHELQTFDAFVFCHKTLESPRCLIEALMCGLPIVGYETDYSRNLIQINEGGLLTPMHDTQKLAHSLLSLYGDRSLLRSLTLKAARDGAPFTDESVFRHRSDLMKSVEINSVNTFYTRDVRAK
jgi:colanic acid/amylovoran biosynthesis glycosyltransferase